MHIKELTYAEFDGFAKANPISSHYESSNYALFMAENGYEYDLIGYVDELGVIRASALILIKKLSFSYRYGYSPKGFLLDYFDYNLLKSFTNAIKEYYKTKLFFIKINPEIAIGKIDIKTKQTTYNQNIIIRDYLKEIGYKKLKDNIYFEALHPRFNAILNLEEYNFDLLKKNTKNKIRNALNKGLVFEKCDRSKLDILYNFIKNKKNINEYYYKNYYNVFSRNNECDLFLVKLDYKEYLLSMKYLYEEQLVINGKLKDKLVHDQNNINVNKKMNSDKALLAYKKNIEIATLGLKENKEIYLAGAFTIKYKNRVNIVISGINTDYKNYNANYFLHYNIIEYYKNDYKFLDLNGLTGNFNIDNPYKGLNDFKLGFKPDIYEFIGEFDLPINEKAYKSMEKKGMLAKEFNRPIKNIKEIK